jgi:prepilin-type N-terminal cleavage/methylation domain-containing protein
MKTNPNHPPQIPGRHRRTIGFTLPELLVALLISLIVMAMAYSALNAIANLSHQSQIKIERRIELSRAFDFMSHEIRAARRINQTATIGADGITPLSEVITSSGLNLDSLGNYGTIALYLEIPMAVSDASCAVTKDYDQVVYDIRPNPSSWFGPRIISRYGRIPQLDGTLNPCSSPIASDVVVDTITAKNPSPMPTCSPPGVLSGSGGFYTCVTQGLVDLYLQSALSNLTSQTLVVASKAFSRIGSISAPVLSATQLPGDQLALSWTWTNPENSTFVLTRLAAGDSSTEIYNGTEMSYTDPLAGANGKSYCYRVRATIGTYTSDDSNQVCEAFE